MKAKKLFCLLIGFMFLNSCDKTVTEWKYPQFDSEPVTDTYFGKKIVDDYRLLESTDTPAVKAWYEEQRQFCSTVMNRITGKDSLVNELKRLISTSRIRAYVPRVGGEKLFIKRIDDEENMQVLLCSDKDGENEVTLFNTSKWNTTEHNYSIDFFEPSYNGRYVAMGVAANGSEVSTMYIIDVEKRQILSDTIPNCYLANPTWLSDNSGFFYNHLKELNTPEDEQTMYENSRVKFHKIGSDPRQDKIVFSKSLVKNLKLQDIDFPFLYTFPNSDKAIAFVYRGSSPYVLLYTAKISNILTNPGNAWSKLADDSNKVTSVNICDNKAFLLSYQKDSKGSLETLSIESPEKSQTVFNDTALILKEIFQNEKSIFIKYLKNGVYGLLEFDPIESKSKEIKLPLKGSVTLAPEYKLSTIDSALYFALEGWTNELAIYKYDGTDISRTDIRPGSEFGNPDYLVTKQVLVPSHDKTLVPLSIIYHKNVKLDGRNPTILYGYGAYGASIEPGFDVTQLPWLNRGGIYAMAHVRGGGENGDEWYQGGFKQTKSNSWKDFIACAEYLIDNKFTSSEKLAAFGGSAGAITVGRALTDRPELFKAAVIQVGALNAIRAETSMNTLSVAEFGTVTDSAEFNYLMDMDVYHHLKKGVQYPSILFTCALNDARVAAWEPSKVVAKMQRYGTGNNVTLLRVSDEGHFGDNDFIKETSDIYAFLLWQLGHPEFKYQQE
jgi:prolyl oligopeptidase